MGAGDTYKDGDLAGGAAVSSGESWDYELSGSYDISQGESVSLSEAGFDGNADYTLEIVFSAAAGSNRCVLFSARNQGANDAPPGATSIDVDSAGRIDFHHVYFSSWQSVLDKGSGLRDGQEHTLRVIWHGTRLAILVDSELVHVDAAKNREAQDSGVTVQLGHQNTNPNDDVTITSFKYRVLPS